MNKIYGLLYWLFWRFTQYQQYFSLLTGSYAQETEFLMIMVFNKLNYCFSKWWVDVIDWEVFKKFCQIFLHIASRVVKEACHCNSRIYINALSYFEKKMYLSVYKHNILDLYEIFIPDRDNTYTQ